MGDEEEGGKWTRRGMRYNERGENDPVYMQQDRNQENAKRRGWQDLRSQGEGKRERAGHAWYDYPTTCF